MRADAVRNQKRILDAARGQIAEHGPEVAMEQIARAAGVAVGTLYRHYPTKRDLVAAVLAGFLESLVGEAEDAARALASRGDAMAALARILGDFTDAAAQNEAVKEVAAALDAAYAHDLPPELDQRARASLGTLLAAGAADGDLRADLTADDVFLLMLTAPSTQPEPSRRRWLELVLAGLRPPAPR